MLDKSTPHLLVDWINIDTGKAANRSVISSPVFTPPDDGNVMAVAQLSSEGAE